MKEKKLVTKMDYYAMQLLLPKRVRNVLEKEAINNGLTPGVFVRTLVMRNLHEKNLLKDD